MTNTASLDIRQNVPLAPFTTIGIGGPARYFLRASTPEEVIRGVQWAAHESVPLFILGGGSNLLISDLGFDGLVVQMDLRGVDVESENSHVFVRAAAGEPWDAFVSWCVDRDLAGVECLSGIPGSIGATPIQNVGAYGQEVSETIDRVDLYDRINGEAVVFSGHECHFAYRDSIFKREGRDRYVVLAVTYKLLRGGPPAVRYPDLQKYFLERETAVPSLREVREAVITVRRRKGMVLDVTDPDTRSDGSFFMNPIVTQEELQRFLQKVGTEKVPSFPASEGRAKLSAAWLIERAGFGKGFVYRHAGLSTKHTLAVINRGGATAAEVRELVDMIQEAVRKKFGIEIHPEPNFVGF